MSPRAMTLDQRRACLERAGHNVFNLDPADIELDFFSDVPPRVVVDAVREPAGEPTGRAPDLAALAVELYGPARYVALGKGRAAEAALAGALGDAVRGPIVTHGLFKSTERALERCGAKIEVAPGHSPQAPTSDLDLAWLERRLAAGGARAVFLEPANNGLGGRPLTTSGLEATSQLCRRHGVLLGLDSTRLLTNAVLLGEPILASARRAAALVDVLVMSCAKELLVPTGALVAVRDAELEKRIFASAFTAGTLLEPAEACRLLGRGMRHVVDHPEVIADRVRQAQRLASALAARGAPCLVPGGGHAAYLEVSSLLSADDPLRHRALEALLYLRDGVRAYIWPYPPFGQVMRLAVTVGRYTDEEIDRVADAVARLFASPEEAPRLTSAGEPIFELNRRYAVRAP